MKIYTKTGDKGTTSLTGGHRIAKDDIRVSAYGDIDELISHIGLLRSEIKEKETLSFLRDIQASLMTASAFVASIEDPTALSPLTENNITELENKIDILTESLPQQMAFVLASSPRVSSECHVARTVCRRAERTLVSVHDDRESILLILKYLNRLSDYLFALSRYLVHINGDSEDFWLP